MATNSSYNFTKFSKPPRSLALVYEVQLQEIFDRYEHTPCTERAAECFRILEEIIPNLGAFGNVVRIIKDEMYRCVYSTDLTSKDVEPFLERLPYFNAVSRLTKYGHEETRKIKMKEEEWQQIIAFREADLQVSYRKSLALKQELHERDMTIKEMAVKYYHLEKLNAEAEFSKAELEKNHHAKQKGLFNKIEELQLGITQSNQIIEKLSVFKSTFGDGQDQSFEDSLQLQKPLEMNPRAFLECNVKQGERLDLQFSEMLDCQLDDFEFQISQLSRKREILALTNSNAVDRENSHKLELREINVSFKKRIDQINEQQRLLQSHMIELKNTLSLKTDDVVSIRPMTEALRKYSTRLLLSKDDGVTFNVFPSTPYCKGCNEKVAMCPHRQTNFTIQIPPSTTHLKLEHAPLKFRTSHLKADFDKIENFDTDGEIIKYEKPFSTLWSDFYEKRGCKKPRLVRIYPLAKLIDYMEEIYDARSLFEETLDEEACTKKGVAVRFIEFFNEFMERRYLVREIAAKPIYDIYMSLIRHSSDSLRVKIFAQTLGGEHDAIWNYLRLISRLISKYEPLDSKQYRNFLTVLYPARTVEMYEQMELEFIAYSKNRFSREFVEDHIMHMLLSEIEPNFTFFSKCLKKGDVQLKGKLTYEDFDEIISHILPKTSRELKKTRFCIILADAVQSKIASSTDRNGVEISRLATASAYMSLASAYDHHWIPQMLISNELLENCKPDTAGAKEDAKNEFTALRADFIQNEVNSVLLEGRTAGHVFNARDIDEETARMAKRMSMMNGDDEDDEEYFKEKRNAFLKLL